MGVGFGLGSTSPAVWKRKPSGASALTPRGTCVATRTLSSLALDRSWLTNLVRGRVGVRC